MKKRGLCGIFVVDPSRLNDQDYLGDETLRELSSIGLDLSRLGKTVMSETEAPSSLKPHTVWDFDGGIWMLHSHEAALTRFITDKSNHLGAVFMFHNFKKRISKFSSQIRSDGFDIDVRALDSSGNISRREREDVSSKQAGTSEEVTAKERRKEFSSVQ
jgi:hypothetical protein